MKNNLVNENIDSKFVIVIDNNGKNIGKYFIRDALTMAINADLDLMQVGIDNTTNLPICKIIDVGAYNYHQSKKHKTVKKVQVKEIRLRPTTDVHDLNVKIKHIISFLKEGHKVKLSVQFSGREINYAELGYNVFNTVGEHINDFGDYDYKPRMDGKQIITLISPKTHGTVKKKKVNLEVSE